MYNTSQIIKPITRELIIMDILELITNLLVGAFTGYTTNSLALKMLFKKYGPFGGVIVKTRDEFIENISNLVERDIINAHTLEDHLHNDDIKVIIDRAVRGFFTISLNGNLNSIQLKNIPGIYKSTENLFLFLGNKNSKNINEMLKKFLQKANLRGLLSEKQIKYITKQLITDLLIISQKSSGLKINLGNLFKDMGNKQIDELISKSFYGLLRNNLLHMLKLKILENDLPELKNDLNILINNISSDLELPLILNNFLKDIKDKTFKDLMLNEDILYEINYNLINIIDNEKSHKITKYILLDIIDNLKKIQRPLNHFIAENYQEKIDTIINKKTGLVIKTSTDFLKEKQTKINNIFDETVDKTLQDEAQNSYLKTTIKKTAYKLYRENSRQTPTDLIISSLQKLDESENTNNNLYLPEYITEIDINSVVSYLTDNNKIDFDLLTEKSCEKLITIFKTINSDQYQDIINKKIAELYSHDKNKKPGYWAKNILKRQSFQDYIKKLLLHKAETNLENLKQSKIKTFIKTDKIINYYNPLTDYMKENKDFFIEKITGIIKKTIAGNSLLDFFSEHNLINKSNIKNLHRLIKKSDSKIIDLYNQIDNKENFHQTISTQLIDYIDENLHMLLKGQISTTIKKSLKTVSDKDLQNLLEEFIGQELKPITLFGALLGTGAAFVLYLIQTSYIPVSSFDFPVTMLVYGLIGYITNVIAIKMIFRPYKSQTFLGIKLPFTPGVVSREKERFAQSIGRFINQELLNHNTVNEILKNNDIEIEKQFVDILTAQNYKYPAKLLNNKSSSLTDFVLSNLQKNRKQIINHLTSSVDIKNLIINYYQVNKENQYSLIPIFKKAIKQYIPDLSSYLHSKTKTTETINSILPEYIKKKIEKKSGIIISKETDSLISFLRSKNLETRLVTLTDKLIKKILNIDISGLPQEIKILLSKTITNIAVNILIEHKKEITKLVNKLLTENSSSLAEIADNLILKNKTTIKKAIIKQSSKKMGFWSKAGSLVNFNNTFDKVIDNFIETGLPEILELYKKEKMNDIINILKFKDEEISSIITGFINNTNTQKIIQENILLILNHLDDIPLKDILSPLEEINIENLINSFSSEIKNVKTSLVNNLEKNKKILIKILMFLLKNHLRNIYTPRS